MYRGGIFDHIGGGFSRYSTDERFLAPHFEKMLYDNALLIMAYCKAYELMKNELYKEVALRTADYVCGDNCCRPVTLELIIKKSPVLSTGLFCQNYSFIR